MVRSFGVTNQNNRNGSGVNRRNDRNRRSESDIRQRNFDRQYTTNNRRNADRQHSINARQNSGRQSAMNTRRIEDEQKNINRFRGNGNAHRQRQKSLYTSR